jgi:COP9 signalosome complex subunit 3
VGLVKQCYQSIRRKRIKELAKVYITVALTNMVPKMGQITLEELERTLVEMVRYIYVIKIELLFTSIIIMFRFIKRKYLRHCQ